MGQMQRGASRHGVKAKAGRQGMARQDKAVVAKWAGGEADRHRPCSKTASRRSGRHRPCSKNSRQMKWASLLPCSMKVGGGSAVVLATRKAGSDLPYSLPPNLSPLPVSVHTHSLNLQKEIKFSPKLFFGFILFFYCPYYNSSP